MNKDGQMIRVTLWAIMAITTLFLFSELLDNIFPTPAAIISESFDLIRTPLMIIQFLGLGTLFVDLVVRFDKLNARFKVLHVLAVGYCIISYIFQIFVFYMDSAFLA
ncbi:MAG: hypothetical protein O2852_06490 [Bacteroidetes bacterium]|jgi:hypothetical protein|nr:hypothetical protein [Bacteroidota bacterium]MDA0980986.1 hypothetical protein [Bacteroidota bacterium]